LRVDPPFEKITIIHADPPTDDPDNPEEKRGTKEYEDLKEKGCDGVEILHEIPDVRTWDASVKQAVIVEDIDVKSLNKEQRSRLDRLFGYISTHKNISAFICCQDFFRTDVNVRRNGNVFIIWKNPDANQMSLIGNRFGVADFRNFMLEHCPKDHDSVWFDETRGSPYPYRFNGYESFNFESDSE
jgi:hypothetical protein